MVTAVGGVACGAQLVPRVSAFGLSLLRPSAYEPLLYHRGLLWPEISKFLLDIFSPLHAWKALTMLSRVLASSVELT